MKVQVILTRNRATNLLHGYVDGDPQKRELVKPATEKLDFAKYYVAKNLRADRRDIEIDFCVDGIQQDLPLDP